MRLSSFSTNVRITANFMNFVRKETYHVYNIKIFLLDSSNLPVTSLFFCFDF